MLQDLLIMTESFLLQGKKIKEQEDKCLGEYGKAAFSNSTQPILNETTGNVIVSRNLQLANRLTLCSQFVVNK